MLLTFTLRSPAWRGRAGAMLLYLVGLLGFAAVLQHRSFFFIAFTIVGFVQPFMLLPTVPAFGIIALTSVIVYTASGGFPEPTVEAWAGWLFLICLQTTLTGFFSFIGTKMTKEHQEHQKLVGDLEAALQENAGLHAQLLTQAREAGVLDERQRMAREIHDTFRIAQEALTNVGRHAMASKVGLTLSYMDTEVLLDVRDDGIGFTPGSPDGNGRGRADHGDGHGFGLNGMAQRLRRVAGKLEIESAPGEGTAVNASVPAIPAEGPR